VKRPANLFYMTPIAPPPSIPQLKLPLLAYTDMGNSQRKWQSRLLERFGRISLQHDQKPGILATLWKDAQRVLNPPFVGAVIGLLLGLTPLGAAKRDLISKSDRFT
jgi:hypothetical protein